MLTPPFHSVFNVNTSHDKLQAEEELDDVDDKSLMTPGVRCF